MTTELDDNKVAREIVQLLEAKALEPRIETRLKSARQAAVSRLEAMYPSPALIAGDNATSTGVLSLRVFAGWNGFVFLVLLLVIMTSAAWYKAQPSVIDGDVMLLASELPPEAYADKDFDQWLASSSRP